MSEIKYGKTKYEIDNAIKRVNARKNEIIIQIRELRRESEILEKTRSTLEDIRDEYVDEFESEENEKCEVGEMAERNVKEE